MDWFYFYQQSKYTQIGLLRDWFTKKRIKKLRDAKGLPVWVQFTQRKLWHGLEEILAQEKERSDIAWRDKDGRGWCHYCVYHNVPTHLAVSGLGQLSTEEWQRKDNFDAAPYDIFPEPSFAQAMAWRMWHDSLEGKDALSAYTHNQKLFQHLYDDAQNSGHFETARVWKFWAQGPHEKDTPLYPGP